MRGSIYLLKIDFKNNPLDGLKKLMKKCFNILQRHCPSCHRIVPWENRRHLYEKPNIKCSSCKSVLAISSKDKAINTALFTLFCIVCINLLDLEPLSFTSCFVVMFFVELCKAFNVLFSFVKVSQSTKTRIME